jgi:hypothetical protein
LPPAGDNFPRTSGVAFVGDTIQLQLQVQEFDTCGSYPVSVSAKWSLVKPTGSTAQISDATESYILVVPGGAYTASVLISDSLGNVLSLAPLSITTGTCGASPIAIALSTQPGALPNTPATVGAAVYSADNDSQQCPPRFASPFTFAWSVNVAPFGGEPQIASPNAASTQFLGKAAGLYALRLDVNTAAVKASQIATLVFVLAQSDLRTDRRSEPVDGRPKRHVFSLRNLGSTGRPRAHGDGHVHGQRHGDLRLPE